MAEILGKIETWFDLEAIRFRWWSESASGFRMGLSWRIHWALEKNC